MWDATFEKILRTYVPFLAPDEQIDPDANLRDLGLDSMGIVEMMSSLENAYDVRFVDDMLNLDTFSTAGVLWSKVSKIAELVA